MGVFAAFQYTQTEAFKNMNEEEANWNPIKTDVPPEPEDEVKVRVWFADNNYFDDHFDLTKREHLIGKTLAKFAQCSERPFLHTNSDENRTIVRDSLELLGWTLFEKWDKASQLITRKENCSTISKACLDAIHLFANKTTANIEEQESLLSSIDKLKVVDVDIQTYLKDQINVSISENESELIDDQESLYKEWIDQRDNEVDRKRKLFEETQRKQIIQQRKQELAREEEKLFFFENYENMEKEKQDKYRE